MMENLGAVLKTPRGKVILVALLLGILLMCFLCVIGLLRGEELPEISLAAEEIPLPFSVPIFGDHIPNTLPATWLTMVILLGLGLAYNVSQRKEGPPSRFRIAVETVAEGLFSFVESVGGEHARLFFPLVATFFLFIAVSNWCGILPGFGSVGVRVAHHGAEAAVVEHEEAVITEHSGEEVVAEHAEEHEEDLVLVPFFRSANAHLSTTLALAVVSVFATHYLGFRVLGISYSSRFINFRATSPKPDPASQKGIQGLVSRIARVVEIVVNGIVGLLEIMLEALKALPFSFRLFGNIFAGEVLLFVVSYLFAFIFPIIFLGLEVFVGLIQALIFSMLTLVFMSVATAHHGPEDSH